MNSASLDLAQRTVLNRGIWCTFSLIALALSFFFFIRCSVSAAFFYSIATFISLGMLAFLFYACLVAHLRTRRGAASKKILFGVLCIAMIFALATELLTLVGAPLSTPFDFSDWSKKRILVFFFLYVAIQLLYLFLPSNGNQIDGYMSDLRSLLSFSRRSRGRTSIFRVIVILCAFVCVSLFISSAAASIGGTIVGRLTFLILLSIAGAAIVALVLFGKKLSPATSFLCLSLLCGSFLVFALPPVTAISWDDEIHYDRALGLSYLGHAEYSEADRLLVNKPWASIDLDFEEVAEYANVVNSSFATAVQSDNFHETIGFVTPIRGISLADFSTLGYLPSAIALWFARLLQLPFSLSIIVGRLGNLISYSIVIAHAIRIAPSKKGVISAIGLMPTSVFLASNYSYDPVVLSFLLLAFALILRELHNPEVPISLGSIISIIAALFVGLSPKAIYFPLVGLLFLIPSSKFSCKKSYRNFCVCVIVFALVMISSFVLPMLFSEAAQAGDARGGSGVSASGQIAYILSNPIEYAQTLGRFMLGYLSPANADMYSISFSYMGFLPSHLPWISAVPFTCLVLAACIDASTESCQVITAWGRVWAAFLFFSSVILVCTALYVSFTPVAHDTINGCQARYLIPLLSCVVLAIPAFNAGRNLENNSDGNDRCLLIPVSSMYGSIAMFVLSILCQYWIVAFW